MPAPLSPARQEVAEAAGERRGGEARHPSPSAEPVPMAAPVPTGPEDDASAVLDELSRNFTYWAPGPGNGSLSSAWYRRNQVRPPPAPGRGDRQLHAGPAVAPGLPASSPHARQRPCEWAERHVTPPHVHPLPSSLSGAADPLPLGCSRPHWWASGSPGTSLARVFPPLLQGSEGNGSGFLLIFTPGSFHSLKKEK